MPMYDFICPNGHTHDAIRSYDLRDTPWPCLDCGEPMSRTWSAPPHIPPDGVYSYAPNLGDPERFERQRAAIKDGVKVIPRTHTKQQREQMEQQADRAHKASRRRS